jgi:anti-anti-sigma factor
MSTAMSPASDIRSLQSIPNAALDDAAVRPPFLALRGDLDVSTVQLLIDAVSALIEWSVGDVVVDLTEVEFIDIASVRILDVARQLLSREGRLLTFRSPSRLAGLVLDLFGLTRFIEASQSAER